MARFNSPPRKPTREELIAFVRSELDAHQVLSADFKAASTNDIFELLRQIIAIGVAAKNPFEEQLSLLMMHGLYQLWLPILESRK